MQPQRIYHLTGKAHDGTTVIDTVLVQDGGIEAHHLDTDEQIETWLTFGAVDKRSDGAFDSGLFHVLDGPLRTP